MKKRIVSLLLAVMMLTSLAGVIGASADGVTNLQFYFAIVAGGALQQTMDAFVNEFNEAHPEYKVEMIYTGTNDDNIIKLQAAAQAGKLPQFYVAPYNYLYMLDSLGIISPLDDLVAADEDGEAYIDGFLDSFIRDSYIDGHLISIPFARSSCIFYYNKDAFREVGLDPDAPPTTWDELVEYAQKLMKTDDNGNVVRYGFGLCENKGHSQWPYTILTAQNGGQINSDDGTHTFFTSEESLNAVQWWVDLHHVYKCVPDYLLAFEDMPNMFIEGKLAMMQHTSGNLTNIYSNADFEVGVCLMPYTKIQTSSTGGQNFFVSPDCTPEEREGAWKFIRYCTEAEQQARWCAACGYLATVEGAYETETLKSYMERVPGVQGALDQLHAGAVTEIATYECQQIWILVNDYLQAAIKQEMTVEEAMTELQNKADAILSEYR